MIGRGLGALLWLDLRQAWHGRLVHVTLAIGLLFGILLRFAAPDEVASGGEAHLADASADGRFAAVLGRAGVQRHASLDAVREAVTAAPEAVGLVLRGDAQAPAATLVLQGHESASTVAALTSGAAALWAREGGLSPGAGVRERVLHPEARPAPFRLRMVPVVIALDVLVIGFFFAGVMILQERALGTVAAYRVTPGTTLAYLASKVLVNVALALVYVALVLAIVPPLALPVGPLLVVITLGSALPTLLGIALAVNFRGLSSFFYPAALLSLVMSAAVPAYFVPALGAPWIRLLPTYQALFALRDLLMPIGREGVVERFAAGMGAGVAVAGALAWWMTHRRLMREVV